MNKQVKDYQTLSDYRDRTIPTRQERRINERHDELAIRLAMQANSASAAQREAEDEYGY